MHTFGEVSFNKDDPAYIGNRLLKNDMSNIDIDHSTVIFPLSMEKLAAG